MPSGYTSPVQKGEVTDLRDFVLLCARGMGPLMLLRDSDQGVEATRRLIEEGAYEEGSYHEDELEKSRRRLAELRAMTVEEALAAARAARAEVEQANREAEERRQAELGRYRAMAAKVQAWEPPTEDHLGLKEFMLEQLAGSIDHDCRPSFEPPFEPPFPSATLRWRDAEIERAERDVAHHEEQVAKSRERDAWRRAWVEALLASLPEAS